MNSGEWLDAAQRGIRNLLPNSAPSPGVFQIARTTLLLSRKLNVPSSEVSSACRSFPDHDIRKSRRPWSPESPSSWRSSTQGSRRPKLKSSGSAACQICFFTVPDRLHSRGTLTRTRPIARSYQRNRSNCRTVQLRNAASSRTSYGKRQMSARHFVDVKACRSGNVCDRYVP